MDGATARRQSLPESMLSHSHLYDAPVTQLETNEDENEHDLDHNQGSKPALDYLSTSFKRSEGTRFAKPSKRKSQSLYENKAVEVTSKSENHMMSHDGFHSMDGPSLPMIRQSSPANALFSPMMSSNDAKDDKMEGEEDHGEHGPHETELDFLFTPLHYPSQVNQHQNQFNPRGFVLNSEQKNGPFDASSIKFPKHRTKMRRSVHDGMPNVHQNFHGFDSGYAGADDLHINQPSSLPAFQQYDALGFNPLNNFQPLTTGMNAFHMNPLGIGMYDPMNVGIGNMNLYSNGLDSGMTLGNHTGNNEIKRRRSRVPSSIYRGVSRCGKDNKFQARIRVNGKVKYLGRFKSEIEAAKCYDKHAVEYLGANAQTNFPNVEGEYQKSEDYQHSEDDFRQNSQDDMQQEPNQVGDVDVA